MRSLFRFLAAGAILGATLVANAEPTTAHLTFFPKLNVADGRSTTTVTAELRDARGRLVPNGTRVIFETSLGTFRESVVSTVDGVARATLVAGGTPGLAKITAKAIGLEGTPTIQEYEFVADRASLSTALEYVEIVTDNHLKYAADSQVIEASAPKQGVTVRYRDVVVEADDIQFTISSYELRARKAKLTVGRQTREFGELYIKLNTRRGSGTTVYQSTRPTSIAAVGNAIVFLDPDGQVAKPVDRFGYVEIVGGTIKQTSLKPYASTFAYEDLSAAPSSVSARKVVVFPNKEVQFHRAAIYVGDTQVMKRNLYQVPLVGMNSPIVTDQIVNISDSNLAINYPHYLNLAPGQTSLLRFRTGQQYGRGLNGTGGAFLDYEMNWNQGDEMQGGLNLTGIARSDWILGANQYWRFRDDSTIFAQLNSNAGKSISGSANYSKQVGTYQMNLSGNIFQPLRSRYSSSQDVSLVLEKDPIKLGNLPFRLYTGVTAISRSGRFFSRTPHTTADGKTEWRDSYDELSDLRGGIRLRAQSSTIQLQPGTSINTSLSLAKEVGQDVGPLSFYSNTTLSHRLSSGMNLVLTHDYMPTADAAIIGSHRLTGQLFYNQGKASFSFYGGTNLVNDRYNYFIDAGYELSNLWRLSTSYTMDSFGSGIGQKYDDYTFVLGYKIGWREVGLTFSKETNRFGIQILGANF